METIEAFLTLVRLGIGNYASGLPKKVDWLKLREIAEQQGLYAVVLDGIEKLPQSYRPPQETLLEWIGEVLQNYEARYRQYEKAIGSLAGWYNQHGFKMMVLKGYACSLDWPRPEHRPCGDIDIWLFGKQKDADAALEAWFKGSKVQGFKIDGSHHHHTVFDWQGFMVENHYDFVNVYAHKSSAELEDIFKELGQDDSHFTGVNGERVYLPSPNLHALFLIRHMVSHFAAAEISLRQVLDWAFFVEKNGKDVDWKWLLAVIEGYKMNDFFNCINAICVEELGFPSSIFPCVQFNPNIKDKILKDILSPAFYGVMPKNILSRIYYKIRRWRSNAWKQELCYSESRWSAFWSGVWAHLLKPKSI